jgi:proline iminopeptidase
MPQGWITVNGVELWAADHGSGHPVLLCPGGPGDGDYLEPVSRLIDDMVRVIRWEPRGCGESDNTGPYDLVTTLSDMDEIRKAMGFERWIVGGHSHGAFLALAYALEYPERVDGIIYLAGTGVQNDRSWHIAYQDARDTAGELRPEVPFETNLDVNRDGNESARAYCRDPFLLKRLAELQVPLLAVSGGEDIRPVWPVEQLVHLMPKAGIVTLPEAGHYIWLTHAESLRAVLRGFLQPLIEHEGGIEISSV